MPRYNMTCPGDRIGVAVSGGADSVVLLHILHKLADQFQIELMVLHANHQLRGRESQADESFVRELAHSLQMRVAVEQSPVRDIGNLEENARLARRDFFQRARKEYGLRRIALGHTRSDQAETVLFRLLRGSGLTGLAGMKPVTDDNLIRPLLHISREEVRAWAVAEGIDWREDSSNANLQFARNKLRNELLPALTRQFNPNLEAVLSHMTEVAQGEEEFWNQRITEIYGKITKRTPLGSFFQIEDLAALHLAEQRRVVRFAIQQIRGNLRSIDSSHIDAILKICCSAHGHDRVIVPGVDAIRSFNRLRLTAVKAGKADSRDYQINLELGRICDLPHNCGKIYLNWINSDEEFYANFKNEQGFFKEVADLDGGQLFGNPAAGELYVRNWQPGDQLHRPGHAGAEKIKSLFQEHRVFLWERSRWPVVVLGTEVVWVRGFGCAAKFKSSAASRGIVRLVYQIDKEKEI